MIPTRLNFKTCLDNPCKKANQTPLALRTELLFTDNEVLLSRYMTIQMWITRWRFRVLEGYLR